MISRIFISFTLRVLASFHSNGQNNSRSWADSLLTAESNEKSSQKELSLKLLDSTIVIFEKAMEPCKVLKALTKKGEILAKKERYEEALEIGKGVLRNWSNSCDSVILVDNQLMIAGVFLDLGDPDAALLEINQASKMLASYKGSMLELKKIYTLKGSSYFIKEDYDSADYYYHKALNQAISINDTLSQARDRFNISIIKYTLGEKDSANFYIGGALKLAKKTSDIQTTNRIYNLLAALDTNFTTQIAYMDTIIGIGKKHKLTNSLSYFYQNRALAYSIQEDYKSAFEDMWLVALYKDTAYSNERAEALVEFQEQFESEKKTRQIKELQLDKLDAEIREVELRQTRNYFLISAGAILVLALALFSRLRFISRTKKLIEKEKEKSDKLLLNILPTEVAKELKEKGRADARDFEMVSILFTDFKGFTEQSAKLSASDLVNEINHCFEAFDGIMDKYGIEKIKTIGDAYMAAGGLPIPTDDSVKNTVLAALEMLAFINVRKKTQDAKGLPAFEMRVGIHTGPVVAGIVGLKKFQYDIWGDTVNTASRMESAGQAGKVNISQATQELLKDNSDFTFENRGKIEAKGKGKIEMYFVS
jgi:adenylate cyclase